MPVLEAIAHDVEKHTAAENVRCSVMLPTGRETKIVVYQHGMDDDPDVDLELSLTGGCSGAAWTTRKPAFANLEIARGNPQMWDITHQQQNKIPGDRNAMMSVPIFDVSINVNRARNVNELPILGVLSIDTTTKLENTGWSDAAPWAVTKAIKWADILARILT